MVGCGAHRVGEEGVTGEEEGEPFGTPQRVTLVDLSDETDREREEGCMLEVVL